MSKHTLHAIALLFAQTQIGQREAAGNTNSGPAVETYLKAVGLGKGYAWCMAFAYWCYKQAAFVLELDNPLYKTAGVLACWNNSQPTCKLSRAELLANPGLVKPGDIIILDYGKGAGHTGIVESVNAKDGALRTIEGNTNDSGDREGYEVARRVRLINNANLKGIIRF